MKHYLPQYEQYTIVVENTRCSGFPLDMLRYDNCVPATESDALRMGDYPGAKGQRITLHYYVLKGGQPHPTSGRWESFGWRVLPRDEAEGHVGHKLPVFERAC